MVDNKISGFRCEPLRALSKALSYIYPNKGNGSFDKNLSGELKGVGLFVILKLD